MVKNANINDISQYVNLYADELEAEWKNLPWRKFEKGIFELQQRIFSAEVNEEYKKARNLQRVLLCKNSALLISIKRVTQINGGRNTPGVDGMVISSDAERMALYYKLKNRSVFLHKASPVRMVYIDKKNGKISNNNVYFVLIFEIKIMPEPYVLKGTRTVLRRESESNLC